MFMTTTTATAARQQLGYRRWQFIVQQHRKIPLCSRLAKRNASTITFHQPYNEIFFTLRYELFSFAINNFLIRAKSSIIEIRRETRKQASYNITLTFLQYNSSCRHSILRWNDEKKRNVWRTDASSIRKFQPVSTDKRTPIALQRPFVPSCFLCEAKSPILHVNHCILSNEKNGTERRGGSGGNKKRQKEREVKIYVIIYA